MRKTQPMVIGQYSICCDDGESMASDSLIPSKESGCRVAEYVLPVIVAEPALLSRQASCTATQTCRIKAVDDNEDVRM